MLLFPVQYSQAEPLLQIDVGDEWVYEVTLESQGFKQIEKENVTFSVENVEYIGNVEQVRVNKIVSDKIVDPFLFEEYEGFITPFDEDDGTMNITFDVQTIWDDNIYRTARGNVIYKRETTALVNISCTDIIIDDLPYEDFDVLVNTTLTEVSDNPAIIETVSTGTVQVNHKTLIFDQISFDFYEFGTVNLMLSYEVTERCEATDTYFNEMFNTTCRNVTYTSIEDRVSNGRLSNVNISIAAQDDVYYNVLQYHEDWVYSFDAGVPLTVEHTSSTSIVKYALEQQQPEDIYMQLIALSIANSDFILGSGTNSSDVPDDNGDVPTWIIGLVMALFGSIVILVAIIVPHVTREEKKKYI